MCGSASTETSETDTYKTRQFTHDQSLGPKCEIRDHAINYRIHELDNSPCMIPMQRAGGAQACRNSLTAASREEACEAELAPWRKDSLHFHLLAFLGGLPVVPPVGATDMILLVRT